MGHLASDRAPVFGRVGSITIALLSIPFLASAASLDTIQISREFFNPSIDQHVLIGFTLEEPGTGSVWILDRDGFPTRRLACEEAWPAGLAVLSWDGRDDQGRVVPDEAYSLKIDVTTSSGQWSYFPGDAPAEELPNRPGSYDMRSGVFSYELPVAARVHIQAGSAVIDPATGKARGPVLKTIANREPRVGGRVIETWNGLDESGQVRVFDLPNFAIAVAATALPENSIITVGNRETTFLEIADDRAGSSWFTRTVSPGRHHQGLNALQDVAPRLVLTPQNARWSEEDRVWKTEGSVVRMTVSVVGPSASAFSRQPGRILAFLDRELAHTMPSQGETATLSLTVPPGQHQATINWVSPHGPVAVNTIVVTAGPEGTSARGGAQ